MAWWIPLAIAGTAAAQSRGQDPDDNSAFGQMGRFVFGGPKDYGQKEQRAYLEKALAEIQGLDVPQLEDISFEDLQKYIYAGDIDPSLLDTDAIRQLTQQSPERMRAHLLGNTAYGDIQLDPRFKQEQLGALDAYGEIADSGGFRLSDEAAINQAMTQSGMADRGRREAITQNMDVRGMGGSGMELLAQLQNAQGTATIDNQMSLDRAGMAQDRVLQSILNSGQLAQSMESNDYQRQAREAQAADAIAQFNVGNKMRAEEVNTSAANRMKDRSVNEMLAAMEFNANAQNQARVGNRDARQSWYDANTDMANKANVYNKNDRLRQQYEMERQKAEALAGAYGGMSNYHQGVGAQRAQADADRNSAWIGAGTKAADIYIDQQRADAARPKPRPQPQQSPYGGDGTGGSIYKKRPMDMF